MAGFVAMISVFVVVVVEMFFAMKGAGHVHGSEYDQLIGGGDTSHEYHGENPEYQGIEGRASTEHIHLNRMAEGSSTDVLSQHSTSSQMQSAAETGQTYANYIASRKEDDDASIDDSESYETTNLNGHHRLTNKLSSNNPQRQLLQCLLLEAGILFHSVFIGMALSVATGTSFVVLLVAICFHQTFEGFALGSRIASLIPDLFGPSSLKPWLMSLAYGTTTPIGQAIGLVLHNFYDPASTTGLLMVGITNAISSGLLLFAGLVELLAEDFLSESSYETLQGRRRIEACIAVASGAILMAIVGAFA